VHVRRLSLRSQADLLELFKVQANRAAVEVVSDHVLSGLLDWTRWLLWFCGAVIALAWITGPYRSAVAVRRTAVAAGRATAGVATGAAGRVRDDDTVAWVVAHRQALQIAGLAVGFLVLLTVDLSWLAFLLLVGAVAAYELWLHRLGEPTVTPRS
jgi:hypothetical protein